ncbi:hypothetical protein CDAR_195611 [Caerostris darwini]|uniref:Uncharacterized protein n=1 Tax=Caerostris darwini TaxID=1538125 RepID=A0AAV4SC93_9ARAC|nr:hypothetical protein CDAR_195611 [Caerostris darwini]
MASAGIPPYWVRFPSSFYSERNLMVFGKISISYFSFAWHSGNEKKSNCRCCASFSPCRVLLLAALWSIFCGKVKRCQITQPQVLICLPYPVGFRQREK